MPNKNVAVQESTVQNIADAIRTKTGTTKDYRPIDFPSMLENIIVPTGNVNISNLNSTDVKNKATAKITDSNLVTGNIKSGATVLGVQGKSSVVDTADANAIASQVKKGKTAYINGTKVTGTGEIYVEGTTLYLPSGWVN